MGNKHLYFVFAVLIISSLACSIGSTPTPEPEEPEVITIVVTATPEEIPPTDIPTEAPVEPTATLAPPTATVVVDTATPEILHFYVSGTVWNDECAPGLDGGTAPTPTALPDGCIAASGGGSVANGSFDAGEPGIEGVVVKLVIDCSYGAFTTTTDANGYYSMSFTVPKSAGVTQQRICLSIDALDPQNAGILIPGGWTYPPNNGGSALLDITIPVEEQNTFNFGWDYQFK